jgi:ribonuclease HI
MSVPDLKNLIAPLCPKPAFWATGEGPQSALGAAGFLAGFRPLAFRVAANRMEASKSRSRTKVYFDGGCRPNPGMIEAAVVIRGEAYLFDDLGQGTNSDAEWLALICALRQARSLGLEDIVLIGDARQIIEHAGEALRTGQAPHAHAATVLDLAKQVPGTRIRWIKRAQNLAGIALAARHPR